MAAFLQHQICLCRFLVRRDFELNRGDFRSQILGIDTRENDICAPVPLGNNPRAGGAPSVERRSHNPKVPSSILGLRNTVLLILTAWLV